jgi:hypothetical protein
MKKIINPKEITHTNQLRCGSKVIEQDGEIAVVYDIYSDKEVSLCLEGYTRKGNMEERDSLTHISELKLLKY